MPGVKSSYGPSRGSLIFVIGARFSSQYWPAFASLLILHAFSITFV